MQLIRFMERIYRFKKSSIKIIFGDIANSESDVIVSSLSMGGGVSPMIRAQLTPYIFSEIKKFIPASLGDVIVTSAGELKNKYIFHVVTIGRKRLSLSKNTNINEVNPSLWRFMIENSINKCFRLMHALDLTSIAFPALGAGAAHIPYEEISSNMIRSLSANISRTNKSINVELYLFKRYPSQSEWDFLPFFENIGKYLPDDFTNSQETNEPDFKNDGSDIGQNPTIFISYSRKDQEQAYAICELLNKNGISYWIDKEGKYSGSNFKGVIVEQIKKSSVVLFLSSQNSNQSSNVIKEIGISVHYQKPIIPIKLDTYSYDVNIEYDLCNIDYIEYNTDKSFTIKLINSIRVHL